MIFYTVQTRHFKFYIACRKHHTLSQVTRQTHHYRRQVEQREEGGTPGIIESIRAGLVFKLKNALGSNFIMERETALFRFAN